MSALLESLLDAERRAECARHDSLASTGTWPELGGNPDPVKGQAIAESVRRGGGSLPVLTNERIAVQPHYWPQVPFRTDRVQHQPRRERRDSRFGELTR